MNGIKTSASEKDLSLTQLADRNRELSNELTLHTNARGFLWNILTGASPLPLLTLSAQADRDTLVTNASVEMQALPQDLVETVLLMMIEHEEKLACEAWSYIASNAVTACEQIKKLKALRAEQEKQQQEDFPQTLPLPTKEEPDESVGEVSKGWPGRTGPRIPGI